MRARSIWALIVSCVAAMASGAEGQLLKSVADLEVAATERELRRLSEKTDEVGAQARALAASVNQGMGVRSRGSSKRVVNGITTIDFPASGALLKGEDHRSASIDCSGTLVGCRSFLTAAHCFIGDPLQPTTWTFNKPQIWKVFFQHAGFFDVEEINWMGASEYVHPNTAGSRSDIALLKLKTPVTGIAPAPVYIGPRVKAGTPGLIVGFGRSGGNNYDYGVKRSGKVGTLNCEHKTYESNLVCWNYDAAVSVPGTESNTCHADSGGGLHIDKEDAVTGITSGGLKSNCLVGDRSYDTDVVSYISWLKPALGVDASPTSCGLPAIDVVRHVSGEEGQLSAAIQQVVRTFDVPVGLATLRVSLNGEDDGNGKNDFDLYLIKGRSVDIGRSVCREDGRGQFAFCEIESPVPGSWTAIVRRKKGAGMFQLVVTQVPNP